MRYVIENGSFYYLVVDLHNNDLMGKFPKLEVASRYCEWLNDNAQS